MQPVARMDQDVGSGAPEVMGGGEVYDGNLGRVTSTLRSTVSSGLMPDMPYQ